MPNRILKESICSSDTVDGLTAEEERLFTRLITKCDDFGCFDARPAILRAECFPLKVDEIDVELVAQWLAALERTGLVRLYTAEGRPYLQMVTWLKHQQKRANKPKYPLPDATNKDECKQVQADASNRLQSLAHVPVSGNVNENVFVNENDAAPNGASPTVSLYDRYAERLKPDGANRAGILGEAHREIFGKPPNHARLGALAKTHGSGEVLRMMVRAGADYRGVDDPVDLVTKMLSARGKANGNGRAVDRSELATGGDNYAALVLENQARRKVTDEGGT